MSGPWEDFKASSTEAGPWDDFTPKEQPTEKNMRVERVQQFYKDVGGGALETIGAVGSNMLLAPIAGLAGLTSLPDGLDAAVSTIGKVFDLGYQPKTDVGKAGAENVSNVLNLPAEYGGKLGEAVAGNEGRLVGEIAGEFATDLLPLGALKRGKGKAKTPEAPKLDNIEKRLDAMVKRDPSNPAVGQMELFPDTLTDTTGYASPYDASTVGTTEPISPKRARRQQELQLDQRETLPVDAEGNVGNIDLGTKTAMEQQRLALERELDATQPIEGLKATEGEGGQQALFDIDESARMPNPTEAVTGDWRIDENGIPVKADLSMEAANLENAAQRNLWGDELPPKHEQELANTSILDNFKNSSISNKGLGRQRGAFNPEVFTFGMRAVTKKLSALTDRLANDPTWMAGIRKAFNGTEPLKNKDGTPVVLLHGTTADIKGGVRGMEQGFHAGYGSDSHFFVQNAGKGGSKAYLDPSNQRRNSQMYPVVIKGGNYPKLAADAGDWSPKEILNKNRDSAKPIRDYISNALNRAGYTESQIDGFFRYVENQQGMAATNQAFSDVLKRAGIDGFFYTNKAESPKSGKLFNLFNRDDVPTRQKIVSQQAKHPESFVTWDNNNFKSVYEAPSTPNQSRMKKPIGQRGFANSQTGAIDFKGFMDDATKLARTVSQMLPKANDILTLKANPHARGQLADERKFIVKRVFQDERGNWKVNGEMYDSKGEEITRFKTSAHPQEKDGFQFEHVNDHDIPLLNFNETKEVAKILEGRRDPFKGPGKNQAGAIRLPFGKKPAVDQLKKIEGIKNDPQMRNIFPEKLSVEEIIKEHAALKTPDVDQNGLQRLMNHLTKGSLYQAIKTDNPIVRVVGEKIRQANNYAMEATGRLVHDGLAPLAQKLSKQEKADVWAVQQMAEAKGVTLTPEFLREEGFNQKQIDWVTEHKAVMDDMYSRMSDSMRAAGLEPVSARVAYVASRARGDFRRLIMKDKKVVGIMGDNTRMGLNKQIERLKKDHPEYEIGQERYYGGRAAKGTEEGFMQMLDFLSKDNPDFKLFVNHVNDMLSQDAFQYMNAKSHTMQKKRIEGMEGRKLYADAVKNAEEGMQAQIRYAETMIKWSELSKAIAEIKPLLRQDNGLDMPNAKEWANEYIQGALGNSPGKLGDALDSVTAAIGKGTGIGTTIPARAVSAMKSYVNGVLLGFGNVGFLTANALQLPRTMPEMAAWLNTKGIEAGYDLGLGRALISVQKQLFNSKLTDLERGAFEYAKKNHVYSSNLFESGNTVSKGLSYYWQKGTQMIASPLERETRKVAFFAYVHMLDEAGIKPSDGLYEAAQNLTDMHMNNYAQAEAPRVYQETGGIGRSAYNLMSFKHNELSRLAMFAREIPNGQGKPILTAMASQVAFAGLIGTLGFAEADAMYEWLTAKMGEPTSLTKILLDNPEIPDALKFGMGSLANVDLTNRMGLQLTPGSMIDLVAPGFGKLGDIGGAVGEMVSQPNLYNAANVAREALPLSVGGIMDRTIFETEGGMALNRNKVSASAVRNDADKLWKALGMTGVNESVQKKLSYENQKIDQVYKDKRSKVIDGAIKEYYMRGVMPDNWVERYIELQGDPKEAKAAIQARIEALNVDRPTKELMQNAASKSISSQHKLLRRLGME